MNEVRISGFLRDIKVCEETTAATAWLEIDPACNRVRIVAVGPRVRELQEFGEGRPVQVIGRLLAEPAQRFGVLIQEITKWCIAEKRPRLSSTQARELKDVYQSEARRGRA